MARLTALGFGPGLAPAGEPVPFLLQADALELWPGEPRRRQVPLSEIALAAGGFDDRVIRLTWTEAGAIWSLNLVDAEMRARFLAAAPPALTRRIEALAETAARGRRRRVVGGAVLAAILLAPVAFAVALWYNADRVVTAVAARVSIETERRLGDALFAQARASLDLVQQTELAAAVNEIGARLAGGAAHPIQWHLARSPELNAFALPGGHVVIFTGLIAAAETPEELAGVMAHELQHVRLRHSLRAALHALGLRAVLALALGDLPATDLGARLAELQFSRAQEHAADRAAVAALQAAGIDPRGLVRFFQRLAARDRGTIALLATHPAAADRIAALETLLPPAAPPPLSYDWPRLRSLAGP